MAYGDRISRAEQLHRSAVRAIDAERRANGGGFAGAVGAEQAEDRAGFDDEIETVERARRAEGLDELTTGEDRQAGSIRGKSEVRSLKFEDFRLQTSDFKLQTSNFRLQTYSLQAGGMLIR
jgi:hypothetical protein